ncbi:type II toxin-antitoxin system prevent-host-death family antitoxin [Xenorhabdus szentirmaii]|uniref:type II toxin-antitoxin system prevent-host-death family antitoxin n=1 Tax=Xenorhabdus szentirmaii TaxID=290112 RepID=UPI0019923EB1|nr:type II toxin-antitoxin system prevent-host-death family antitoxin [Xenorhabdus sp. 38]MBD2779402.1 type II toxin-antitoxin system Phd/YefM family antitoxin [Xenorhabdus sp. 38]
MAITTLSSRELSQNIARAKKATKNGPVFITVRGKHAHVLLSIEEYRLLTKKHRNIADSLAMPGVVDIEFKPQRVTIKTRREI